MDLLNATQITSLSQEYATLNTIDPCGETYPKMIALLNGMSQAQLKQLAGAKIKFLSRLALNRIAH